MQSSKTDLAWRLGLDFGAGSRWILLMGVFAFAACGGGGGGTAGQAPSPPNQDGPYTVSWTVTGLTGGSGLTLDINGGFDIAVVADGSVTSTVPLFPGETYESSVAVQPTSQVCSIMDRTGVVDHEDIDLQVTCAPTPETVLHSLSSSDGVDTNANLIQASDGNFYGTTPEGGANSGGTAFRITPQGVYTVLFPFGGTSQTGASIPVGAFVQGANGNLYGTTTGGGVLNNGGTVFEMTLQGDVTILHSFGSLLYDVAVPQSGLILASDGNFYGTAPVGGANGSGGVYRITPLGDETVVYSFGASGSGDGQYPGTPLVEGSDGNFYGTTEHGGAGAPAADYGTVFRVTPQGAETVLYSFGATTGDGRRPTAALLQGSDGNLYGTTPSGGKNGFGTVFRISPAGAFETIYSFGGAVMDDGEDPASALVEGPDGAMYGTTPAGASGGTLYPAGTVFRITPAGAESIVYSFGVTNNGIENDGLYPRAGLVLANDGNLYGVTTEGGDYSGGAVFKISVPAMH